MKAWIEELSRGGYTVPGYRPEDILYTSCVVGFLAVVYQPVTGDRYRGLAYIKII